MNARDAFRNGIEVMQQSAKMMGLFMPGRGVFCDWRELDSKFEAFRLFQYADRELKLPVASLALDEVVRRTLVLDAFRAIWIMEGVGHIKGNAAGLSMTGLMTEGAAAFVPERALLPMHTGMGLAFAENLLGGLGSKPSMLEIRDAVEQFVDVCRANCRPGWEDASVEPIGLVVRCLYPHLMASVSSAMEAVDFSLRALFWHGVGRSLYFVPTNFMPIPGAHSRMLSSALAESNRGDDRRQIIAGLIWAVTLVNLPQTAVIRSLIPICSELGLRSEFTNGLISALLAWRHMAPSDLRHIANYTQTPLTSEPDAMLFHEWIERPAKEALRELFPGLASQNRIAALYTCRTEEELRELSFAPDGVSV